MSSLDSEAQRRLGKVRVFPVDATGLVRRRRRRHRRLFISSPFFFGTHTCEVIPLTVTLSSSYSAFAFQIRNLLQRRSPPDLPLTQPGRAALEAYANDVTRFSPLFSHQSTYISASDSSNSLSSIRTITRTLGRRTREKPSEESVPSLIRISMRSFDKHDSLRGSRNLSWLPQGQSSCFAAMMNLEARRGLRFL